MVVFQWYEALRMKLDDPDTMKVFEYQGNEKLSNEVGSRPRALANAGNVVLMLRIV